MVVADGDQPVRAGPRVAIAHASRMVTEGLAALLADSASLRVVSASCELPTLTADDAPDVLVLDPALADPSTFAAFGRELPGMRVLLVADASEPERTVCYLATGAAGLVDSSASVDAVAHAVHAATQGLGVVPARYLRIAADHLSTAFGDDLSHLDEDELRLWRHVVDGLDFASIAERHFVSERTARRHVDALLEKLGVENRLQAAELAGRVFLRERVPAD